MVHELQGKILAELKHRKIWPRLYEPKSQTFFSHSGNVLLHCVVLVCHHEEIVDNPIVQLLDHDRERCAQFGQAIVDARWNLFVVVAFDEMELLKPLQSLRQHLLRNSLN